LFEIGVRGKPLDSACRAAFAAQVTGTEGQAAALPE